MKNLTLIIVALLTFSSCANLEKDIIGTWKLIEVENQDITEIEKQTTFTLYEDGKCVVKKNGKASQELQWVVDKKGESLTLNDGDKKTEFFTKLNLTNDTLSFVDEETKLTFVRN